ncbi:hypothetical protein ACSE3M_01540 [Bacillus velezensis]
MAGKGRIIFHIDMNSFYASVEMAYDPSLRGKPIAVAGNVKERKGIIVTCSYEARARGVKTTMLRCGGQNASVRNSSSCLRILTATGVRQKKCSAF